MEYAPFHGGYIDGVPDDEDLLALLRRQGEETAALLRGVGEEQSRYRYAPGKWSVREVIGHVVDAERVFTYRALRFARADATALPAFDEVAWGASSNADQRPIAEHAAELATVRAASLALFGGFTPAMFARAGSAGGHNVTVGALLYVTIGHERHHVRILRERYGV